MASWEGFKHGCRRGLKTIGIVRPVFPLFMMGVGAFIPALNVPVAVPEQNNLWIALALSLGFILVWLAGEIATVVDRNTSVGHLQWDDISSLVMAVALTEWHGRLVATGQLRWWFVLPWLAALLDAALSGWFAINNAAQKPLVQQQKGG